MNKVIKKILETIENNGFEAYLVGGFVRDYLLGIKSLDVDICTNALPKDLHQMFPLNNNSNNYGGFNLKINGYNIDITTYRLELKYNKRKPVEITYINDLKKDVLRRDFTINAICMDKNEKVIDLLGGIDDLNNHLIKIIGNTEVKIKEDPLRILRAIRFASTRNFLIDSSLDKVIRENYELVKTLSDIRIKTELTKILLHKNFLKGLELLKEYQILALLGISYDDITYVNDICGMWAQLNITKYFAFTKQEIRNIINIRQIVKNGVIDNHTLYKFGLYNCLVAADILNKDKKQINEMYKKIPLKNEGDLALKTEELLTLLQIKPSKEVKALKEEIIALILDEKIENTKEDIIKYLRK